MVGVKRGPPIPSGGFSFLFAVSSPFLAGAVGWRHTLQARDLCGLGAGPWDQALFPPPLTPLCPLSLGFPTCQMQWWW